MGMWRGLQTEEETTAQVIRRSLGITHLEQEVENLKQQVKKLERTAVKKGKKS